MIFQIMPGNTPSLLLKNIPKKYLPNDSISPYSRRKFPGKFAPAEFSFLDNNGLFIYYSFYSKE